MPRNAANQKVMTEAYWMGNTTPTTFDNPDEFESLAIDSISFEPTHQVWIPGAPLPDYLTGSVYIRWDFDVLVGTGSQQINISLFKNDVIVERDGESGILKNGEIDHVNGFAVLFLTGGDRIELKIANLISDTEILIVNGNIGILR